MSNRARRRRSTLQTAFIAMARAQGCTCNPTVRMKDPNEQGIDHAADMLHDPGCPLVAAGSTYGALVHPGRRHL